MSMNYKIFKQIFLDGIKGLKTYFFSSRRDSYGYISPTTKVYQPTTGAKKNVYLYDNTVIHDGARFITPVGKFIMRRNSTASYGLTVITFSHGMDINSMPNDGYNSYQELSANDVEVKEGCLIGANVTLLPGVTIPRGCIVGAGSVLTKSHKFPPYCIIAGNPAKFIKFRFTLDEMLTYEKKFFDLKDRYQEEELRNFIKSINNTIKS